MATEDIPITSGLLTYVIKDGLLNLLAQDDKLVATYTHSFSSTPDKPYLSLSFPDLPSYDNQHDCLV